MAKGLSMQKKRTRERKKKKKQPEYPKAGAKASLRTKAIAEYMRIQDRLANMEDRLILLQNRVTGLECNRHEDIQRLVEASIRELRQAGKFKCSKCNR